MTLVFGRRFTKPGRSYIPYLAANRHENPSPLLALSLLIFASSARKKGKRHLHPYGRDEYGYHTNKITGCRIATA